MKRLIPILTAICILLLFAHPFLHSRVDLRDYPIQTDFGTLTAAEQEAFLDILEAVDQEQTVVPYEGIISHERILTHLGMHYGTTKQLSELYRCGDGYLWLDLERFGELEEDRIAMESRVTEALLHIREGSDRYKLRQIARYIAKNYAYEEGEFMCGDYAMLFYKMASRLGFQSYICYGYAGGFHAWNMVKLDGTPYYYDITWFDGILPNNRYLHSKTSWGRTATLNDKWEGAGQERHHHITKEEQQCPLSKKPSQPETAGTRQTTKSLLSAPCFIPSAARSPTRKCSSSNGWRTAAST